MTQRATPWRDGVTKRKLSHSICVPKEKHFIIITNQFNVPYNHTVFILLIIYIIPLILKILSLAQRIKLIRNIIALSLENIL